MSVAPQDDPRQKSRSEDSIIAYTWAHFINNGTNEPFWLLRLPMTKVCLKKIQIKYWVRVISLSWTDIFQTFQSWKACEK